MPAPSVRNVAPLRFGKEVRRRRKSLGLTLEASRGWKVEHAQKSDAREDGYFGLFGASVATSKKRDFGRVIPTAVKEKDAAAHKTRYELFFLVQPGGGKFKLSVDGEVVGTISTKAGKGKPASPGYHALTRDGGPHTIEVKPVGERFGAAPFDIETLLEFGSNSRGFLLGVFQIEDANDLPQGL